MNNLRDIRTAVIGVGSMGRNHARVLNEISDLVAVIDPNESVGRLVSKECKTEWYSDYKEILGELDAVSVAVPTILHKEVTFDLINAGISVLVEKPLAGNVSDAEAIVNFANSKGVVLAVGHIERYNPVINLSKQKIVDSKWGDILTLSAKRFSSYPSRISDVGVLFDLTIHDVDIIRYLADSKVVGVFASGGKIKSHSNEDFVNLHLHFENGILGLCETNWLTPMKVRKLSMTTTSNFIDIDYLSQSIEVLSSDFRNIDEKNLYNSSMKIKTETINVKKEEPLKLELIDFLSSVISKKKPLVDGNEGVEAVKIVEAGLNSLKKGILVNI